MNIQQKFAPIRFQLAGLFVAALVAAVWLSWNLSHNLQHLAIRAGGETTIENRTAQGFAQPIATLSPAELELHLEGDGAFEAKFVTAPATVNPGLGPLFNNSSCRACHVRDGRGLPVNGNLLVRVSLPPGHSTIPSIGNAPPVPNLGNQIQDHSIYGSTPTATVDVGWQEKVATYGDGSIYNLRSPQIKITLPNGQPLPQNVLTSARVAPPIFGRGLLEAIDETVILALADPTDRNGDGISGKANQVWDVQKKALALGRFGLKANTPNLLQQNAAAYVNDMGVTNPLFPESNGKSDIDSETLKSTTFYTQTLSVPARTMTDDADVKKGERLFMAANCAACHIAELKTGQHPVKVLANQTIHPYTDLLVHNMGEGLADGRPDFAADGTEWRTPPLWGLGLTQTVLPYTGYLHDGRARTLAEAILWHGGEAEKSKESFRSMPDSDRSALISFLNSL
jgi:CxxC motif-containing protein (DUF1111 family)